jgi:hypothetical protein
MKRSKSGVLIFDDHPEFRPNVTPREMFQEGVFGGTYWRPIFSSVVNRNYSDAQSEFDWHKDIDDSRLSSTSYNKNINLYGVKSGSSLESWESSGWITDHDPYGWVQWYCRFYDGRRLPEEDLRQIKRWVGIASENGRFRKRLMNMIDARGTSLDDINVSPTIRQTLLHWGFLLRKTPQ